MASAWLPQWWPTLTRRATAQEHLFLVCELLRANLYEFQKYNRESADPPYFTLPRVQSIARQVSALLAARPLPLPAWGTASLCVIASRGGPSFLDDDL